MAQLNVTEETARKLRQIAEEQENRSLDDVLRSMIDTYPQAELPATNWALRMAQMAEADTDIEWKEDTKSP